MVEALRFAPDGGGSIPELISVAERSKAKVYGRQLTRIAGLKPAGGISVLLRVVEEYVTRGQRT